MTRSVALAVLVACTASDPPAVPAPTPPEAPPAPAESLAGRTHPDVEVWFMAGRPARDSAGTPCFERTLEIRGPDGRRRVPLLYTLEAPTRLDDSSVRARVFRDCQPGDWYRVSVRTGLPTPLIR